MKLSLFNKQKLEQPLNPSPEVGKEGFDFFDVFDPNILNKLVSMVGCKSGEISQNDLEKIRRFVREKKEGTEWYINNLDIKLYILPSGEILLGYPNNKFAEEIAKRGRMRSTNS